MSTFFEDQGRVPGIGRVQPDLVSGPVKIFQGYIILNQGGYYIPVLGLTLDLNNDIISILNMGIHHGVSFDLNRKAFLSAKKLPINAQKLLNEVDPLTCPKCQGRMRIISFIENEEVVKKILEHLGLWLVKSKPTPQANGPPGELHIDYSDSQIPPFDDYPCTDIVCPAAF